MYLCMAMKLQRNQQQQQQQTNKEQSEPPQQHCCHGMAGLQRWLAGFMVATTRINTPTSISIRSRTVKSHHCYPPTIRANNYKYVHKSRHIHPHTPTKCGQVRIYCQTAVTCRVLFAWPKHPSSAPPKTPPKQSNSQLTQQWCSSPPLRVTRKSFAYNFFDGACCLPLVPHSPPAGFIWRRQRAI